MSRSVVPAARLAIRVSSPDAARQALSLGADYVLAPLRRERPSFVADRLAERDEPEIFLAIAADENLPAEPARVARLREIEEVDGLGDFAAVLLDPDRALLRAFRSEQLRLFVERCRAVGVECWLGGALEAPDVPRLLALGPDALVFDEDAPLATLRALLREPEPWDEDGPTDLVLVRDFVVPLGIGAYGFERGRPQRVRFGVEAEVVRPLRRPREIGDVYSYDLILDAVRRLAERGHTDLVETLAEDLAAMVLADGRVRRARVVVEKLDLGPDAVGIRIERTRSDLLID